MDIEKVKSFLGKYRLLITKTARLKSMMSICPEKKSLYLTEIKKCVKVRDRIEKAIDSVDGDILSEILSLKYMCGKTLEEIALDICYSKRQTERLYKRALSLVKI